MKRLFYSMLWGALMLSLMFGISNAKANTQSVLYGLRAEATLTTLLANGDNSTTLYAFLTSENGSGIDGERVRFALQEGRAYLSTPQVGSIATLSGNQGQETEIAVDGVNIGNGVYVARMRAGTVAGTVTIAAEWLSSPDNPIPVATVSIDLVTAEQITVRVDDTDVVNDGVDTATIIAYVVDGLGRPVENADVRFRIVNGAGTITPITRSTRPADSSTAATLPYEVMIEGTRGRYAALYRSATTPGQATIEVSLPTITNPIRATTTINVVEASNLSAVALPVTVGRLSGNSRPKPENTSVILVAVRDGDGDLVSGLGANDLEADIISGPGDVVGFDEITINGEGTGVYSFTFIASEITGPSVIQIVDVQSPGVPRTELTINTVTEVSPGIIDRVVLESFADEPFFSDGESEALIVALATDVDGNAIRGLEDAAEFSLITGQGRIQERGTEILNSLTREGTGIYVSQYTSGTAGRDTTVDIRATFSATNGDVVTGTTVLDLSTLREPEVVVFPNTIPTNRVVRSVIDIYDVNDQFLNSNITNRYSVNIEAGPGEIITQPNDDGIFPDLVAGDNISSAIYEINEQAASNQNVQLRITDRGIAGIGTTDANLSIGAETRILAVVSPDPADAGEMAEIIAFAQDEFGLPAIGHELVVTVVSGSASIVNGGRMVDDGSNILGFRDAFGDDGAYVGAVDISGVATGTVVVRITDLTPPSQPSTDVIITIAR
ncbi:MAG: hypothetical protein CUN54_05755 [Phototrophicales bacterium]|nr:MAG: hypothetical protein CUN54_05755 [Phototrophicales bacterium]